MAYAMNEDVIKRIEQALQIGATYEDAARYGGISYNSLRNWLIRGEREIERRDAGKVNANAKLYKDEQKYVDFVERIRNAEGASVVGWLAKIEAAIKEGQWQAAAWKLERRYPKAWAKRTYAKIEGLDELLEQAERLGINPKDLIAAVRDSLIEAGDES